MKVGLQICSFTWPGGTEAIGPTLARVARQADDVGFDSIWVMDHFFQIRGVGRPEEPMLESYSTLGFLAGVTSRIRLGALVGCAVFRSPGLLVKTATTVDVRRPAAVILKASFDNRWRVVVDGRELDAQMFAPGFVGRMVSPGRHEVLFEYVPFPRYDVLLAIGAVAFVALLVAPERIAARRRPSVRGGPVDARVAAPAGRG